MLISWGLATYTPVLESLDHVLAHLDVIVRFVGCPNSCVRMDLPSH